MLLKVRSGNMGRGGHHFSGGRIYRSYGSSGGDLPLGFYIVMLLVTLGLVFIVNTSNSDHIRSGDRISVEYVLSDYLYDEADYFDDNKEHLVVEGLEYFYQATGAQMVIVTQSESTSDKLTEEKYHYMFDDEAHVLIVLPITGLFGGNNVQYYYMGDEALKVIDETGMNRMLENIDGSWSSLEEKWKQEIIDIADMILSY